MSPSYYSSCLKHLSRHFQVRALWEVRADWHNIRPLLKAATLKPLSLLIVVMPFQRCLWSTCSRDVNDKWLENRWGFTHLLVVAQHKKFHLLYNPNTMTKQYRYGSYYERKSKKCLFFNHSSRRLKTEGSVEMHHRSWEPDASESWAAIARRVEQLTTGWNLWTLLRILFQWRQLSRLT